MEAPAASVEYPSAPHELTLGRWLEFHARYGRELDERAAEIDEQEDNDFAEIDRELHTVERAYACIAFFQGYSVADRKRAVPVANAVRFYTDLQKCFHPTPLPQGYSLPAFELSQASPISFGEILDSKAMEQTAKVLEWSRWELLRHLCAVWLRPDGEPYSEADGYLDGEKLVAMNDVTMGVALSVGDWYSALNEHLQAAFTVFQPSSIKSGEAAKRHFEAWGWVNFLKSIAKTKVFDIPSSGMNSIDCARQAKAFDVLMYASEEKEYTEAQSADFDAQMRNR